MVTNGQKFLFFCHSSQTSPSKTSTAKPFSVFSFSYHIPMWTLSVMNRSHSPLSYVWYFADGYGTSTSARKVSKSDPKQKSYIILKMHTVWNPPHSSKNTSCSAFDPFWHLLHYLSFMNNELNITTTLNIPVRYHVKICTVHFKAARGLLICFCVAAFKSVNCRKFYKTWML